MRNYYFFKSTTYRNEQGEVRRCLRALPGQRMVNGDDASAEVSAINHVQCDAATLTMVCRLPLGTIFGCYEEGNTYNRSTLTIYHRNGNEFYRPTMIWAVKVPGERGMVTGYDSNDADERRLAVCAAYNDLIAPRQGAAAQSQAAPAAEPQGQAAPEAPAEAVPNESPFMIRGHQEKVEAIRSALQASNPRGVAVEALSFTLDLLCRGAVSFSYRKQNGDMRSAVGTTNPQLLRELLGDNIPELRRDDGRRNEWNDGEHIYYFDIPKNAWRCFCTRDFCAAGPTIIVAGTQQSAALRGMLGSTASEV